MGKRGPKAKTAAQKKAEGNPGRRPVDAAHGPGWPTGVPARPPWLLSMAVDVWELIVPQIAAAGVLSPLDQIALGSYCQCVARYIEAEAFMTSHGTVMEIRSDKGEVKSQSPAPEFTIALKYLEKANQLGERFGLTPVSRQTLKSGEAQESALTKFLNASQGAT